MSQSVSAMPIAQLRAEFYRVVETPLPRQTRLLSYALALSVLVHVGGLSGWGDTDKRIDLQHPADLERSVSVRLLPPATRAVPKPDQPLQQVSAASAPEPRPVQAVAPRELAKVPARPSRQQSQSTAAPKVPAPETVQQQTASIPATPSSSSSDADARAEQQRARYLAALFAHIERHKFYPAVARRQGLEAAVDVSFSLSAVGGVEAINVSNGPKLLRQAAQQSLQHAVPLPLPPAGQSLPMRIEYRMVFALR